MAVIHFTLSKYKSGKTFVAWLLAQYHMSNGQPLRVIDLDPNGSIIKFKALSPKQINITKANSQTGEIEYSFNTILATIQNTYSDMLLDTTSDMFNIIVNNFRKDNCVLMDVFNNLDLKIVFHIPISGGQYTNDNISTVNEILKTIPDVNVVVWLNHYPNPVFDSDMNNAEQNRLFSHFIDSNKLKYIVNLPILTSGETVTRDNDLMLLKKMLSEKRIFDEILDPRKFKFAESPTLGDIPVFIITDYQISFLRDEFEKVIQNVAEVAS